MFEVEASTWRATFSAWEEEGDGGAMHFILLLIDCDGWIDGMNCWDEVIICTIPFLFTHKRRVWCLACSSNNKRVLATWTVGDLLLALF